MDHDKAVDELVAAIQQAQQHADFLDGLAELLREEGLDAQPTSDSPTPHNYIKIHHQGRYYVVATDGDNLIVRHVPPEVKIPLADPEVFNKVKTLCHKTWP